VVVSRYQDLVAWQLADELKRKVYDLVDNSSARHDFSFCDQIKKSASSAATNIAEGFAYFEHPEFAKHVRIAKSELTETHSHLGDGMDRRHWTGDQVKPMQELANRAIAVTTRLLEHLKKSDAPSRWPTRGKRR
jgi:four helix bundle protein